MPFGNALSVLFSIIGVGLIIISYIVFLRLMKKDFVNEKSYRIIGLYSIIILVIGSILYFGFYLWNFDIISIYIDDWATFKETIIGHLDKLLSSALVLFIGLGLVRVVNFALNYSQKKSLKNNKRRYQTILKVTQSMTNYSIKLILILIILAIWGVNVLPALAGLGILGLVVGFGAQDLMKDIIAGFFIIFEKHFDIGDIVEINGFKGEVIDIGLKTTKVMNWKKDVKLFNNSSVQNAINYSFTESMAIVEVGITYDQNISDVVTVLNNELVHTIDKISDIIEQPQCVGAISFGDSAINLRVVAKTNTEKQYAVERSLRNEIKEIFDRNNIEIPFTQIVIHHPTKED